MVDAASDSASDAARSWSAFCARLGEIGGRLAEPPFPASETDRALCARHLSRQVVLALQSEVDFGDAADPLFHRSSST